jgi:hypothetical protein
MVGVTISYSCEHYEHCIYGRTPYARSAERGCAVRVTKGPFGGTIITQGLGTRTRTGVGQILVARAVAQGFVGC